MMFKLKMEQRVFTNTIKKINLVEQVSEESSNINKMELLKAFMMDKLSTKKCKATEE